MKLTLSQNAIKGKNKEQLKYENFLIRNLKPNQLLTWIKLGYAYGGIFETENDLITPKQRNNKNWRGSQIITFDIDNCQSDISLYEYIETLQQKPTIAYTTINNLIRKANDDKAYSRFRLLYCFDDIITDERTYKALYYELSQYALNHRLLDERKKDDDCGVIVTQIFFGNNSDDIITYNSNIIYNIKDFNIEINNVEKKNNDGDITSKQESRKSIKKEYNNEVINDFFSLNRNQFIGKYKDTFAFINETKLNYNDRGYAMLNDDYINITFKYEIKPYQSNEQIKFKPFLHILKDGEHRRKTLFNHSVLRKQIKPNITFEEMLFNVIYEAFYFCDNQDNQLTNEILYDIAKNALNDKYHINTTNKKKFKVNKTYCQENNISANSYSKVVRKMLNYEQIGEVYDIRLSVKENLIILREMGIKVSLMTLYRFCKEFGINPKGEKRKESIESDEAIKSEEHTINIDNVIIQDEAIRKTLNEYHRPNLQRVYDYLDFTMNKETYKQIYHFAI